MKIGSLFSGYGGLDLATEAVLGARTAWHCELDPHASKVLSVHWPDVPNLGDITAVDWAQVEPVDVLCGGFPCQDISSAGRGAGIKEGTRSGLWFRMADAVRVLRPRLVVVENVRALLVRGIDTVLGDMAAIGYDARWQGLRAADVGAPHQRWRIFLVAWPADAAGEPRRTPWNAEPGDGTPAHGGRGQTELGRRRSAAADPGRVQPERHRGPGVLAGASGRPEGEARQRERGRDAALDRSPAASDADGHGFRRLTGPQGGRHPLQPDLGDHTDRRRMVDRSGPYAAAIHRWEQILGRCAPDPTDDRGRLNPWFVEWMMGLPEGWVCDLLDRNPALRALGNGVVPQQAEAALRILLEPTVLDGAA